MSNSSVESDIVRIVEEAIESLIISVEESPLIHFGEHDLHKLLYHSLLRRFEEEGIERSSTTRKMGGVLKNDTYIIHSEFGNRNRSNSPIDLVVLNPQNISDINKPRLKIDRDYPLPLIAIEMKTELNIGKVGEISSHLQRDVDKLLASEAMYRYFIIIYRDETKESLRRTHLNKIREVNQFVISSISENQVSIISRFIHLKWGYVGLAEDDWERGLRQAERRNRN